MSLDTAKLQNKNEIPPKIDITFLYLRSNLANN